MQLLSELLNIFSRFAPKGRRVLSRKDLLESNHSVPELARRIQKNPSQGLKTLSEGLPNSANSKVLASKLKRILLDGLFVLDLSRDKKFSNYTLRFYRCEKDLFCAKVLVMIGARELAAKLAKRALKEAQILERTSLEMQVLDILRYNSFYHGRKQEHKRYNDRLVIVREILAAEQTADFLQEEAILPYVRSKQPAAGAGKTMEAGVEQVRLLFEKHRSFELGSTYYRFAIYMHQASEDYESAIVVAKEAIIFIKGRKIFATSRNLMEFYAQTLASEVNLMLTDEAAATAEMCLNLVRHGSTNWYVILEKKLLLAMQLKDFGAARSIVNEAVQHEHFASMAEHTKVRWQLFQGYANFVNEVQTKESYEQKLSEATRKTLFGPIRGYEKDKAGFNFASIVLQILHLFEQRDYDSILDRLDALRRYGGRYLKEYPQAAAFLDILTIAYSCNGDVAILKPQLPQFVEQLSGLLKKSGMIEGLQVIPYPITMPIFIDRLERFTIPLKKKRKKKGASVETDA